MQAYSHGVFGRHVHVPEAFDELVAEAEKERSAAMAEGG
jgi:hypothetical protein